MKVKSKKTVTKRFKVTGTGKLRHSVGQWNHMRIKKGTKTHTRKGVSRVIASSKQTKMLKAYMAKSK